MRPRNLRIKRPIMQGDAGVNDAQALAPFAEVVALWREQYVEKLREIHKLRIDARKQKAETEKEIHDFLLALIDSIDSFDKTIAGIEQALSAEDKKAKRVLKNFSLLRKQFAGVIKKFGVTPMEVGNGEFVAGLQKAVGTVYDPDLPEGHVARVEKAGYYWKDHILRPAEVLVASSTEDVSEEDDD